MQDCSCNQGFLKSPDGTACVRQQNLNGPRPACFNASAPLEDVCNAAHVPVRGCAPSEFDVGSHVLQVGDDGTALADISSSCSAFYSWLCERGGGYRGENLDCSFYCEYFLESVKEELFPACSESRCAAEGPTPLQLHPTPASLCFPRAEYALYSSCSVPNSRRDQFASFAADFLRGSRTECSLGGDGDFTTAQEENIEKIHVADTGEGPNFITSFECAERTDCRYACFNHGFEFSRHFSELLVVSEYVGTCNCSVRGVFKGSISFVGEIEMYATNAMGETLHAFPHRAFNQIMGYFYIGEVDQECVYTWDLVSGSLGGLPIEKPTQSTRDATLEFLGYVEDLSGINAATQRRQLPVSQLAAGSGVLFSRPSIRSDAPEFDPFACPQEEADCRYACLSAGFSAETFGADVVLQPLYDDGLCDCNQTFGETQLHGGIKDEITHVEYLFSGAFRSSFLPTAMEDRNSSSVSALLRPLDSSTMLLDVGPGVCAYRMMVTLGVLIDVGPGVTERGSATGRVEVPDVESPIVTDAVNEVTGDLTAQEDLQTPIPLTSEQTSRIAEALSGTIGSIVIVTVVASVASTVQSSTDASSAGGGGGGGGSACLGLVQQAQFMSVAARVGGPSAQPPANQAFSDGLEIFNFHVLKLPYQSQNASAEAARNRRAGRRPIADGGSGAAADLGRDCPSTRASTRELGSTATSCACAIFLVYLARVGVNKLIAYLQTRRGVDMSEEPPTLPFLSWELQVVGLVFMGLCEGAGEAISSNCLVYEITGGITFLLLLLLIAFACFGTALAVRSKCIVFVKISHTHAINEALQVIRDTHGHSWIKKIRMVGEAWKIISERGEWEVVEDHPRLKIFGERLLDRYGSLFDACRGAAFWYGFFQLCKLLVLGVVLAAVTSERWNASVVTALQVVDASVLLLWLPHSDWREFVLTTYRTILNLATLATVVAYISETMSVGWFTNMFAWLNCASVVPAALASALAVFKPLMALIATCFHATSRQLPPAFGSSHLVGGLAAATTIAKTDLDTQIAVLQAAEQDPASEQEERSPSSDSVAPNSIHPEAFPPQPERAAAAITGEAVYMGGRQVVVSGRAHAQQGPPPSNPVYFSLGSAGPLWPPAPVHLLGSDLRRLYPPVQPGLLQGPPNTA